jgi:hypothetical protein
MTTFTQPLAGATRPAATIERDGIERDGGALSGLRASLREWRNAFRAAGRTPTATGMDPVVLYMFGRD